jgi:hypothetical protein
MAVFQVDEIRCVVGGFSWRLLRLKSFGLGKTKS